MKKSKVVASLALALSMVAGSVVEAGTLGDYFEATASVVPNKLSLSITEEMTYTDNVNSTPDRDKRDSLSLDSSLSLQIYRELKNGIKYGVDADVSYEWYDDREMRDDSEIEWSISPMLLGEFNLLDTDSLMLRFHASSEFEEFDNTDTKKTRKDVVGGDITYDYKGGGHLGFAIITTYDYNHYTGEHSDRTNSEYEVSFAPYYKFTQMTKLGLRAAYGETLYKNNREQDDSETLTLNAFLDHQLTGKVSLHMELGMERVEYDVFDGEDGDETRSSSDEGWEPTVSASVNYQAAKNVSFSYTTEYSMEDTTSDEARGGRNSWSNSLSMSWELTSKVNLNQTLSYDFQDEKNGSNDDNGEWTYSCEAGYKVSDKMRIYLGYEYTNVSFKYEGDEDYQVNEWTLGMSYAF